MCRHALIFLSILLSIPAFPQLVLEGEAKGADVVVIGRRETVDDGTVFQAIWRNVSGGQGEMKFQRATAAVEDDRLMLDRLLLTALTAYMDARIHFTKQGVRTDVPAERMVEEMDAMISSATKEFGVPHGPIGLTPSTTRQLERLLKIDWSQARSAVDGGDEQDKYLAIYYYVRSQRNELERQMRADLVALAGIPVLGSDRLTPGQEVRISSTCGTVYDQDNYLCALDLRLADAGTEWIDPPMHAMLETWQPSTADRPREMVMPVKMRKRDRWLKAELEMLNERIDNIDQRRELWKLRDRLDDLEDRVTGLEMELREGDEAVGESEGTIGVPVITIRFGRNSTRIDPQYGVLLNEVFEQLVRAPGSKALITGYCDKVGDPTVNLRLSERRAKAVRDHLFQRGISADRLLVNHYGDSRSSTHDPSERRVEIEWLPTDD